VEFSGIAAVENGEPFSVKTHQATGRSQPQIPGSVLYYVQDRIVGQAAFGLPRIQRILGYLFLRIKTPEMADDADEKKEQKNAFMKIQVEFGTGRDE